MRSEQRGGKHNPVSYVCVSMTQVYTSILRAIYTPNPCFTCSVYANSSHSFLPTENVSLSHAERHQLFIDDTSSSGLGFYGDSRSRSFQMYTFFNRNINYFLPPIPISIFVNKYKKNNITHKGNIQAAYRPGSCPLWKGGLAGILSGQL